MDNITIVDSLLEAMQTEWNEEDLGAFLCNVYALGYSDGMYNIDTEINQNFLLMSPIMQVDIVQDYLLNSVDEDLVGSVDYIPDDIENEFCGYEDFFEEDDFT